MSLWALAGKTFQPLENSTLKHQHFRYLKDRSPKPGFYNPQPMVHRYGSTIKNGNRNGHHNSRSGTLRSEYSGVSTNPAQSYASRQLGTAMSMQSQQSMTATSTML